MTRKLLILFLFFVQFCKAQPAYKIVAGKEFSERFAVSPLNINSSFSEFSPFISKNKLYFISNRNTNVAVVYTSKSNQNTADIFVSNRLDSLTFSKPKNVTELNSVYDDGPIVLNAKGDYMVFSASNKKGKLQIYFSQLVNGKWTKPLLHPVSRVANSYCHPFLSTDANTLFFCSDKEGGYGGMDIYYSKLQSLNWSNPVNLGAKVNTSSNETFPFITPDRQLYFSSERQSGKGGLDIYSFDLKDSAKATVQLLAAPINSAFDDFAICFDSAQQTGYFSSNRNKQENDNIYYFKELVPEFEQCAPMKKNSCYTFMKEEYSLKDETHGRFYVWDFGDGGKAKAKAVKHCYSKSGFYTVKLNVLEEATGKIIYNELSYTIAIRPQGLQIDVKDTLYLNTPLLFDAAASQIDGYTILNYNWIFNDTTFSKGSLAEHQYHKNGIYLVELGVEAQNVVNKQIKKFCIEKWILVGDKSFVEKNLRYFKYAELLPDADSLYFQNDDDASLNSKVNTTTFRYARLSADAYGLSGQGEEDIALNEEELRLRNHHFSKLNSDDAALDKMNEEDAALSEQERKLRLHKFSALNADKSSLENSNEEDAKLKARQRLMRFKNASLPPIVDTLYFPKETDETIFRVNLGWSDSKVDKNSGVFDGIKKLEESQEGKRYRYTSGKEKEFDSIVPYYQEAKQKGFKDAAVVGFVNETINKGQAKNLRAIIFDSASVENQAVKVFFKYDVPTYDSKYNTQLDSLMKNANAKENPKVLLITHFDGLGGVEYNMNLNRKRTNNMIKYLVSKGIKKTQIKTEFIIHPTEKLEPDLLRRIEVFLMN